MKIPSCIVIVALMASISGAVEHRVGEPKVNYGSPIDSGIVIVAGRRLEAPYRMGRSGRKLVVNGHPIAELPGVRGRMSDPQALKFPIADRFVADFEHWLYKGHAIVVFDERVRLVADKSDAAKFLKSLADAKTLEERLRLAVSSDIDVSDNGAPVRMPTSQWRGVLEGFQLTEDMCGLITEHSGAACQAEVDGNSDAVTAAADGESQNDGLARNPRTVTRGFLFVNGKYVNRPYHFYRQGEDYFVNHINLVSLGIDLSGYEKDDRDRREVYLRNHGKPSDRDPLNLMAGLHAEVASALSARGLVVLNEKLSPVWYNDSSAADLLSALAGDDKLAAMVAAEDSFVTFSDGVTHIKDVESHLATWIASFQPTMQLLSDSAGYLRRSEQAAFENAESSQASVRLANFGYPLTIAMMVMVVMSFGHLLSHRPDSDDLETESKLGVFDRPFNRSLVLIGGLSTADLVWTLLVSQAGAMREMNPVGSQIISDPVKLVVFKVFVTIVAIGLIYCCRHVPLARRASWWGCLILTLVAARWLLFNSMFV